MRVSDVLIGSLAGVAICLVVLFVPFVEELAPLIGGFAAGYLSAQGVWGGLVTGLIMTAIMVVPAYLLSEMIVGILSGIPIIGDLLRSAGFIILVIIVTYVGVLGVLGGILGGYMREQELVEMEMFRRSGRKCPSCGAPIPSGRSACPYCDTPIAFDEK